MNTCRKCGNEPSYLSERIQDDDGAGFAFLCDDCYEIMRNVYNIQPLEVE
jgi:alpha-D-ribose 1-methylphosphonate 5-phosphate C-P lyase